MPNGFQPLRDMSSQITKKKIDHDIDEYASIEQHQQMDNWFDEADFHPSNSSETITSMTIHRLEEQIQMLRTKVEDINARLENVTSILQETHSGNVS